ncbi:hypothetical protein Pint_22051 [Pistacia integerrima]|uniref:Uncharacterized protein n=1 Tax=Pistacia integerrima TaxID=434235 RepID=A0ACC0YKM7_9ROSI|nr:hypothetical protein Pint_22051 [Pistacia integerrima]
MNSLIRSLSKSTSSNNKNSVNSDEHNMENSNIENHLKKWKVPKFSKKAVYETSIFNFRKDCSIETTERKVPLSNKLECIKLFDQQAVRRHTEKYKYLHIGLVQVGVRPLTHEGVNTSILLCLRDKRLLDFNNSLLSVLQSSLVDGPVYFNCFPNIMVFLQDPNIMHVLTLNIKLQNLETQETCFPVVLMYRVHYKCLVDPFNTAARKSSSRDKTLFFQTKIRRPSIDIPRVIKWSEIQFPEEWKLQDENPRSNKNVNRPKP